MRQALDLEESRGPNPNTNRWSGNNAAGALIMAFGICRQGVGRSRKSWIIGVYASPIGLQTHTESWRVSPSTLEGLAGQTPDIDDFWLRPKRLLQMPRILVRAPVA